MHELKDTGLIVAFKSPGRRKVIVPTCEHEGVEVCQLAGSRLPFNAPVPPQISQHILFCPIILRSKMSTEQLNDWLNTLCEAVETMPKNVNKACAVTAKNDVDSENDEDCEMGDGDGGGGGDDEDSDLDIPIGDNDVDDDDGVGSDDDDDEDLDEGEEIDELTAIKAAIADNVVSVNDCL